MEAFDNLLFKLGNKKALKVKQLYLFILHL